MSADGFVWMAEGHEMQQGRQGHSTTLALIVSSVDLLAKQTVPPMASSSDVVLGLQGEGGL
jgi:hypothetical protein